MLIISEGGLYRLIARSRKPAAVRFCNWVFDEVLPQIRKTGSYIPPAAAPAIPYPEPDPVLLAVASLPPAPSGYGELAVLPGPKGPRPDLATLHMANLLNARIGDVEGRWAGLLDDLIATALSRRLFFWKIQDAKNQGQRVAFSLALKARRHIDYAGIHGSHLHLDTIPKRGGHHYVIIRRQGNLDTDNTIDFVPPTLRLAQ